MNPLQFSLARANAYALFETLFLRGITPSTIQTLQQVPTLAKTVDLERGFEELAADHYSLFVHNLPPYASIFLEQDAQPGGDITEQAAKSYKDCGFAPKGTSEAADHIGHMLGCLGFLCGAESDAWEDGVPQVAGQMRQIQAEILEKQILPWFFPFLVGVQNHGNRFFTVLIQLVFDTMADHYTTLQNFHGRFPQAVKEDRKPLTDDKTSLNDIADFLLKPAKSGLWLSPDMIAELGRAFQLPRGFGDRRTILLNLLKSAGKYEEFTQLTEKISDRFSNAHFSFEKIKVEQPHLSPFLFPWSIRISDTNSVLHQLTKTWHETHALESEANKSD